MTHVLLTAGLNEIPVLVAAYRLCCHYRDLDKCLPRFSILCSDESREEAGRVRRELARKLKHEKLIADERELAWKEWLVHPYRPAQIRMKVEEVLAEEPSPTRYHLNYTGGSKAMGVHAIEALVQSKRPFEISYVDPEEYRLYDSNDAIIDFVEDERRHWRLSAVKLPELHGFEPIGDPNRQPEPRHIQTGCQLLGVLRDRAANKAFQQWLNQAPKNCRPAWPTLSHATWQEVCGAMDAAFPKPGDWTWKEAPGWKFLHGRALELHAFSAAGEALRALGPKAWRGFDVHYRRVRGSGPDFELDVMLILGFELVAVSCSIASGKSIKHKGFEVVHRARQIGGSNARAIVVCIESEERRLEIQAELRDDLGGRDKNVEVWGASQVDRLKDAFQDYLVGIGWGNRT